MKGVQGSGGGKWGENYRETAYLSPQWGKVGEDKGMDHMKKGVKNGDWVK